MAENGGDEEMQDTNPENESQEPSESDKNERVNKLPLTRIKHIIKMDPDVTLASQDAVIMIAKAAVSFFFKLLSLLKFSRKEKLKNLPFLSVLPTV